MEENQIEELNRIQSMEEGKHPAFPLIDNGEINYGLSKREYIAIKLMASMLSNGSNVEFSAGVAVTGADFLLSKLKENRKK